jgi:hypothetical protein
MSGFLGTLGNVTSTLSNITNTVNAFSSLFGGYGTVTLGSVTFTGQEVPEHIEIGGAQALTTHKLPGGARVVDAMGRDDIPLTWSGVMLGAGSEARMLSIDAIRVAGQPITLAFGTSSYTVVVSDFKGTYRRANFCEYTITCEVVQDNSASASTLSSFLPTQLQQVTSDISSALNSIPPGLTTVLSAVLPAQAALAVTGALNEGTAAFGAASTLLGSAQTAITGAISTAGSAISALSGATGILGTGVGFASTADAITNLTSAVNNANIIGNLTTAGGYIERTATNLAGGVVSGISDIL